MLKRFAQSLGLIRKEDKGYITKKEFSNVPKTMGMNVQSRDVYVRIVHAGGREELYQNAVSVSQLMEKYPGMCVARPEVFKNPSESLLWPENKLLPGQKYYMIPSTTAQKLKQKHLEKFKIQGPAEGVVDMSDARITWEVRGDNMDESVRSAKDFYVSGESWSERPNKRGVRKKKAFVPPLPKTRMFHGYEWEPSLTSVLELSP